MPTSQKMSPTLKALTLGSAKPAPLKISTCFPSVRCVNPPVPPI